MLFESERFRSKLAYKAYGLNIYYIYPLVSKLRCRHIIHIWKELNNKLKHLTEIIKDIPIYSCEEIWNNLGDCDNPKLMKKFKGKIKTGRLQYDCEEYYVAILNNDNQFMFIQGYFF